MTRIIRETDGISIQESAFSGEVITLSFDERAGQLKARMMLTTPEPIRASLTLQFDLTPQAAIDLRDWLTTWLDVHAGDPEIARAVEDAKIVTHTFNLFNTDAAAADAPRPRRILDGMIDFDTGEIHITTDEE